MVCFSCLEDSEIGKLYRAATDGCLEKKVNGESLYFEFLALQGQLRPQWPDGHSRHLPGLDPIKVIGVQLKENCRRLLKSTELMSGTFAVYMSS